MARITRYHYLSHDELLRLFSDKRDSSDIIEEVCQRLERELGNGYPNPDKEEEHNDRVTCPVCDAELRVEDEETGYRLRVV